MRVVLFGAGASHGSGTVVPRVPPLGPQLFKALRRLYASWQAVPSEAARHFEENFEKGMAYIIEKYSMAIAPLMQDMAVFFSAFAIPPGASNRYRALLDAALGRSDLIWSTLNYECLLEFAVAHAGKQVAYFEDPDKLHSMAVPIWKLHGSCNFKVTGIEAGRGVSFGTGVVFGGGIQPIDPAAVRPYYKGNTALYPAMALFASGKPIAMSPAPIKDAQDRWARHVAEADRIIVIGVNPNPADAHIWKPLAETSGVIAYVGDEGAFDAWRAIHRPALPCRLFGSRWEAADTHITAFIAG